MTASLHVVRIVPVEPETKRNADGTFGPGTKAGPGRPALPSWFKDRAPEALKHLLDVAVGEAPADPKTRLRAAEIVVERFYGKAQESVELTGSLGVVDQLARLVLQADQRAPAVTSSTDDPPKQG